MNMEIFGWIAAISLVVGYILNAHKRNVSWLFWYGGNAFMFIYGMLTDSHPIAVLSLVLAVVNVYGYYRWAR